MVARQHHINEYVSILLSNKKFLYCEFQKYIDSCYTLPECEGEISPSLLNKVIRRARWNIKIRKMLSGILCYVNGSSMTEENFHLLTKFPKRYRNTFFSFIAHTDLAFHQMQLVNRISGSFEAFAWLFDKMCKYDCFSKQDVNQILRDNSGITYAGIRACVYSAIEKYGNTEKTKEALHWITQGQGRR